MNESSKQILSKAHPLLQRLFQEVDHGFPCIVTCSVRGEKEQNEAFRNKLSKLPYPKSKHNQEPSLAVDVIPDPLDWKDTNRMYFFGGFVTSKAQSMGIKIRWGGDWDSDTQVNDQTFIDLPHFELL